MEDPFNRRDDGSPRWSGINDNMANRDGLSRLDNGILTTRDNLLTKFRTARVV